MVSLPPPYGQAPLFQLPQVIALREIFPVTGEAGVVVGVVQNLLFAVDGIQPLLLRGKAGRLGRVFLVAAAALTLVMGQLQYMVCYRFYILRKSTIQNQQKLHS